MFSQRNLDLLKEVKKENFKSSESLIFWSLVTTIDYSPEWVMNTFGLIKE